MEFQLKIWVSVFAPNKKLSCFLYELLPFEASSLILYELDAYIGAKFGGYGSFLSMYQRSPACKSPPQVQNQVVTSLYNSKCVSLLREALSE